MPAAALASLLALTAPPPAVVTPAAPPAAAPADRLAERFAAQVAFDPKAPEAERSLYAQAVGVLLATPTGRSLAERLAEAGERVEVSFADFTDIGGLADEAAPVGHVQLARSLVSWPADWAATETAATLAHELLGHTLFGRLASDAGLGWEYNASLDDEVNAEVVGWLVELEAGWKFPDPGAKRLLADRAGYERALQWEEPAYCAGLRGEELGDALSALKGRLAEADAQGKTAYHDALAPRVTLLADREDLRERLARYPRSAFYAAFEAELAARIERLRALAPARPAPSEALAYARLPPL